MKLMSEFFFAGGGWVLQLFFPVITLVLSSSRRILSFHAKRACTPLVARGADPASCGFDSRGPFWVETSGSEHQLLVLNCGDLGAG